MSLAAPPPPSPHTGWYKIQAAVTDSQLELSYYMFQTFVSLSAGMIHASGCPLCLLAGLFFFFFPVRLVLGVDGLFVDVHSYKAAVSQLL